MSIPPQKCPIVIVTACPSSLKQLNTKHPTSPFFSKLPILTYCLAASGSLWSHVGRHGWLPSRPTPSTGLLSDSRRLPGDVRNTRLGSQNTSLDRSSEHFSTHAEQVTRVMTRDRLPLGNEEKEIGSTMPGRSHLPSACQILMK